MKNDIVRVNSIMYYILHSILKVQRFSPLIRKHWVCLIAASERSNNVLTYKRSQHYTCHLRWSPQRLGGEWASQLYTVLWTTHNTVNFTVHNQITPSAICIGLNVSESYTTIKMYTPNWSSALCIGVKVIIVYTCMTEHTALG